MSFKLTIKDDCPEIIARRAQDALHVTGDFYDLFSEDIQEAAKALALCFANDQRVFTAGTGISASLARIMADVLCGGKASGRPPLPAAALLSSLATDEGTAAGDQAFARQLEGLGRDGDILMIFTHEGTEPALIQAATTAHEQGMLVLGISGGDGGILAERDLFDLELRVPSIEEPLIHEVHMGLVCLLDELTDYYLSCKPEILKELIQSGTSADDMANDPDGK